jgi:EAL domain-containing protein (putative c-di-GMP-specific phosphodiesterase class I)
MKPFVKIALLAAALQRIRLAGATVAVDDVGAGFSTLRHVLCVAPDIVKLDIRLTRAAALTHEGRTQALAFISAAREVGAIVAAEGIETAAELAVMTGLGVDLAQGFYLHEPCPLETIFASRYSLT